MSTILFVDDHHSFRTVFAEILRNAGDAVLEAGTAADVENLMACYSGPIDVLAIEAVLTTTNGLAIVQQFQKSRPETHVLFISPVSADALMREGLMPKGAHFLRKPFGAEQFVTTLQDIMKPAVSHKQPARSRTRLHAPKPVRTTPKKSEKPAPDGTIGKGA